MHNQQNSFSFPEMYTSYFFEMSGTNLSSWFWFSLFFIDHISSWSGLFFLMREVCVCAHVHACRQIESGVWVQKHDQSTQLFNLTKGTLTDVPDLPHNRECMSRHRSHVITCSTRTSLVFDCVGPSCLGIPFGVFLLFFFPSFLSLHGGFSTWLQ